MHRALKARVTWTFKLIKVVTLMCIGAVSLVACNDGSPVGTNPLGVKLAVTAVPALNNSAVKTYAYIGTSGGYLYAYPIVKGQVIGGEKPIAGGKVSNSISAIALSPNQNWLYTVDEHDHVIELFNIDQNTGAPVFVSNASRLKINNDKDKHKREHPNDLVVSPDNRWLYVSGGNRNIYIYSINQYTGRLTYANRYTIDKNFQLASLAVDKGKGSIYAAITTGYTGLYKFAAQFNTTPAAIMVESHMTNSCGDYRTNMLAANTKQAKLYLLTQSGHLTSYSSQLQGVAAKYAESFTAVDISQCASQNCKSFIALAADNKELFFISAQAQDVKTPHFITMVKLDANGDLVAGSAIKQSNFTPTGSTFNFAEYPRAMAVDYQQQYLYVLTDDNSGVKNFSVHFRTYNIDENRQQLSYSDMSDMMTTIPIASHYSIVLANLVPNLQMVTPEPNATNLALNARVQIGLAANIDVGYLNKSNFTLMQTDTAGITSAMDFDFSCTGNGICTLTPVSLFTPAAQVTVSSANLWVNDGSAVPNTSWSFSIESTFALSSPTVADYNHLPLMQQFVFNLPSAVDVTSVNAANVQLYLLTSNGESQLVPWANSGIYVADQQQSTFTPQQELSSLTPYLLVVTNIKDRSGNIFPSQQFLLQTQQGNLAIDNLPESMHLYGPWIDNLVDIPVNQFGLSGYLITNHTPYPLSDIHVAVPWPSAEFSLDIQRSSCVNFTADAPLAVESNCSIVMMYQPILVTGSSSFALSVAGMNGESQVQVSRVMPVNYNSLALWQVGHSRRKKHVSH